MLIFHSYLRRHLELQKLIFIMQAAEGSKTISARSNKKVHNIHIKQYIN